MKLSVVKKILIEELPSEVKQWFPFVSGPLNVFMDSVVRALTGQLTIDDNFKAQKFRISIESNQSYPFKLAYKLNERPTAVTVGELTPSDGSVAAAYGFQWVYDNGSLYITFSGLAAVKHSLTLIAQV